MGRTLYEVLGLQRTATQEEIETASLAKGSEFAQNQSDDPEAARLFSEVERAYEVLSNTEARREYDADLDLAARIDSALSDMTQL